MSYQLWQTKHVSWQGWCKITGCLKVFNFTGPFLKSSLMGRSELGKILMRRTHSLRSSFLLDLFERHVRAHVAEHVKRQREQKSPPGDDSFLHSFAQILVSYPGLGQGSFVGAWSPGARPLLLQWHCMCARPADGYWFRSELGDPIWSHLLRLTRPPYGATIQPDSGF